MRHEGHRLDQYRLFATSDLDEARETVARVFCPHRLEAHGARRIDTVHNRVDLKSFSLNYIHYGAEVDIDPGALQRFYLLQIPIAGSAYVRCGAQETEAWETRGTLLSPSQPVRMRWSADCRKILVQIERSAVERAAEAMVGRVLSRPLNFDVGLDFDQPSLATLRRLVMMLCEDQEMGGVLGDGLAGARYGELLIASLLENLRHSYSGALDGVTRCIAPAHVKRAERFMREHAAEPIGLADIARASGVSVRSLQDGFRRFREITPLECLRDLRIEEARAELLAGNAGETVTTIAMRWGFTHLSRFAAAYRRRFGETPSETLRHGGMGAMEAGCRRLTSPSG